METYRIRIGRPSPMIEARWCSPVGWTPTNELPHCRFVDGAWCDGDEEIARMICFTTLREGDEVEVEIDELCIAARGQWRIIDNVFAESAARRNATELLLR